MNTNPLSFFAAAVCLLAATRSPAAVWYVNPIGGGSGTTPASPMLPQQAIDASAAGDLIVFAAATYNVGSAAGLEMVLAGKNLTLEGAADAATVLNVTAGNIDISGWSVVTMRNMLIQNGTGTRCLVSGGSKLVLLESTVRWFTAPEAVSVSGGFAQFERCNFDTNIVGILVGSGSDISVTGCQFTNHESAGVDFRDSTTVSRITSSTFTNNTDGIHIQPTYEETDALVDRNQFYGNGCGVAMLSMTGGLIARDKIWSNTFYGSTSSAVYSGFGANQADIQGNWIQFNNRGVYLQGTGDTVHNNVIVDGSGAGNGIEVAGAAARVAHNTVSHNTNHGIVARSADTSLYVNNISVQNGSHGLRAQASPAARVGYNNCNANAVNFAGPYVNLGGNLTVAAGFMGAYDFRLKAVSAMINAATSTWFAEPIDFEGKARIPGLADIGAFER